MIIKTLLLGVASYLPVTLIILRRWQYGLFLLLAYIPISGVAIVLTGYSPLAVLFKDFAFIAPMYIGFFWFIRERESPRGIPRAFAGMIWLHVFLVLVQMFNPNASSLLVSLIGAKVWLFYIPLMLVAYNFVNSRERLCELLRPAVVMSWIPMSIGLLQWILCSSIGYRETMRMFYGASASAATQGFARFDFGITLFRIPSTFSFSAQYSTYLWAAILMAHMLAYLDPSKKWRRFAKISFAVAIVAYLFSGARGAFFFVPLLLGTVYSLQFGFRGIVKVLAVIVFAWFTLSYAVGVDTVKLAKNIQTLLGHYHRELVVNEMVKAYDLAPLGMGTGMNTIAARYAFTADDFARKKLVGIESYYGKAMVELGLFGLISFLIWQITLIAQALRVNARTRSKELKAVTASIAGLVIIMAVSNFKSFRMDFDPLNMYYWIFIGVLFRIRSINSMERKHPESKDVSANSSVLKTKKLATE